MSSNKPKQKTGLFGKIHSDYSRKGQKAVDHLVKVKNGEVPNAIYNKNIGWIDLVWGYVGTAKSDGYGLSKIVKYHPEVVPILHETVRKMSIVNESQNRFVLADKSYKAVISRVWFENKKTWCLTAYKIDRKKETQPKD